MPWLNFHRPCQFASETVDACGKVRKRCRDMATPCERLKLLPDAAGFLKTDLEAVMRKNEAQAATFDRIFQQPVAA